MEELQKIKKLHENLVPLRNEKINGLNVYSKFAAGESPGGEFFDVIKGRHEIVFLLVSTNSYLSSSIALSSFEDLKNQKNLSFDDIEGFVGTLHKNIKAIEDEKDDYNFSLLLFKIDTKKMDFSGFSFGKNLIFSSEGFIDYGNDYPVNEAFLSKSKINYSLSQEEKVVILSPGFRENCNDFMNNEKIIDYLDSFIDVSPRDFINETFFHLKKNKSTQFLKHDGSCIFFEVDKNAIIEV